MDFERFLTRIVAMLAVAAGPALILALALGLAISPARAATDPAGQIERYNDGIVAIMQAGLPIAGRVERFEVLVAAHYDMPGIAALVVGPKWSAAPAAERSAAIAALTHHSAVSLAKNFARFAGERFAVDPVVARRGTSAIVKVTIQSKGRSDVLQYRLREAGEWRIIDVVSAGVSNLALQRAELAATIASDGVTGMTRKLAAKDAELVKK